MIFPTFRTESSALPQKKELIKSSLLSSFPEEDPRTQAQMSPGKYVWQIRFLFWQSRRPDTSGEKVNK